MPVSLRRKRNFKNEDETMGGVLGLLGIAVIVIAVAIFKSRSEHNLWRELMQESWDEARKAGKTDVEWATKTRDELTYRYGKVNEHSFRKDRRMKLLAAMEVMICWPEGQNILADG